MDGQRFDQLTRHLASRQTRRRFLGGLAAFAGALAGPERAAAACPSGQYVGSGGRCLCRASGRPPAGGVCPCAAGQTACASGCVDLFSDAANCGACGNACPAGLPCAAGACRCPHGRTLCGEGCSNLMSDPANCGACGHACGADEVCETGVCVATCTPIGAFCEDGVDTCCPEDGTVCDFSATFSTVPAHRCCRPVGNACSLQEDCCVTHVSGNVFPVDCAGGVCGAAGAGCEVNVACASGVCCGSQFGVQLGTCCAAGEVCSAPDAAGVCQPG